MADPVKILIVGGGTAGWMTAAALARFLTHGYEITLVESEEIGSVGVGEATIPQIHLFNTALGLDEDAFIRATQGTFKLGIEFVDWLKPGHRYMHAFGAIGRDIGLAPFQHHWLRAGGAAGHLRLYSLNEQAALAGKMQRGKPRTAATLPDMPYAFHFDAGLYAQMLRSYGEARGVRRIEGKIIEVALKGETGDVDSVLLEGDRRLTADFFIDCSGFRGLLIEDALKTGFEDWSHWLPCDRAFAVPCTSVSPLTPYTRSNARAAGWQWRIPLQHRIGNGHVFSSAHMSEDAARALLLSNLDGEPLAEPRLIRFKAGKRRKIWNRNVLSIGLSSGFLEPLESTSIHLIQSAISRLLKLLPGKSVTPPERDEFNRQADFEYDSIRDFIILHYKANARTGDAFWRDCREMAVPDSLAAKMALFESSGHIFREHEELFTEVGWMQVLLGQGVTPRGRHPAADLIPQKDLLEYLGILKELIDREVAQMPTHEAFIAAHCSAGAS